MALSDADAVREALGRTAGLTQTEREALTGIDQSNWSRWIGWEKGDKELAPVSVRNRRLLDAFLARPRAPTRAGTAGVLESTAHLIDSTVPLLTPDDEAAFQMLAAAVERMRETIRRLRNGDAHEE